MNDYIPVLMQWGFLFVLLALFAIPAMILTRIARKHNRQPWMYAILGLAITFASWEISNVIIRKIESRYPDIHTTAYFALSCVVALLLITGAMMLIKRRLIKSNQAKE